MNTNRGLSHKVLRAKYRKYALRISLLTHVIMMIAMVFFIKSETQELEDEFEVELIREVPRQVVKKKPPPVPKVETPEPETPKPEMPQVSENRPERRKMTSEKAVSVVQPKHSVEIAKLPVSTSTGVDMQQPSVKRSDVDATALSETPDFATAADLPADPESVLSPIGTTDGSPDHGSRTRRGQTGARSPKTGVGEGIRKAVRQPGARQTTGKTTRKAQGRGTGGGSTATTGDGAATFSSIIADLTDDIIGSSGGKPIDVVFVVDASGSMQDNINAVAEHLGQMVDAYKAAEIEYQLGLTHFYTTQPSQRTQENKIQVFQLTQDLSKYKRRLYEIVPTGDENALDALSETVQQLRFSTHTIKHLILVTDEPFTSLHGHTVASIIQLCQRNELAVHVLGLPIPEHQQIAAETGGSYHAVPQNLMQQRQPTPRAVGAQAIGDLILADGANLPVDVIFFIDASKSMTDKVPYITQQIDLWIRNWDHAIIDYRIGVVRFRAEQSVNMVTVFKPPQTQEQIHKILRLPCEDDENLLHAVVEGERRLQRRPNVKTHFILITDEPGNPKAPIAGTIGLLKELPVVVSVIGASDPFQQQVASATGGVYVRMPNALTRSTPNE